MKRTYLISAGTVALAMVLFFTASSFDKKVPQATPRYYEYNSGTQSNPGSYSVLTTAPDDCEGAATICYITVHDLNGDNVVNNADFAIRFSQLDTDSDGTLDDQSPSSNLVKRN
ncbi:hypothetical protein [Foetidibacter luteolus]|uniref:hypothetical protein n=1 Tax=Foetidibacter luteolus TaxID=2608880 RepID=UPI00129A2183|nr:hypothetical protein [Foetidibacter luteolus]